MATQLVFKQANKLVANDKIVVSDEDSKWVETVQQTPETHAGTVMVWTDQRLLRLPWSQDVVVQVELEML